jgi:transposase
MTTPYSLDLRERVVWAVEHGGMSRNQAAARYGVAVSSAVKWVARFRATGSAAPAKMGGYKPKRAGQGRRRRRREQWQKYQGRIDAKRLVFIDETWTKTSMTPLRGWGPCGARVKGRAPFGRWKTMTCSSWHLI